VSVDELHRITGLERPPPREHLVIDHPERVEVGALVDPAVHPPGPLGRDIRQDLGEDARPVELLVLAGDLGVGAEAAELEGEIGKDDDVARPDVVVTEAVAVDGGDGVGERNGRIEEERERQLALRSVFTTSSRRSFDGDDAPRTRRCRPRASAGHSEGSSASALQQPVLFPGLTPSRPVNFR
jgi:hypothetical protein